MERIFEISERLVNATSLEFRQIADRPDSYIAADGIETAYGSRIPLWMFGLLY